MLYKYETVMIFDPTMTVEITGAEVEKFKQIIRDNGHIGRVEELGTKSLAYPIRRDRGEFKEGYYCVFTYMTRPEVIAEIERQCRIDDHVLKFITVKTEDAEIEESDLISESEQQPDVKPDASNIDLFDLIFNYDTHLTSSQDCDIISKKKGVK